MTGALRSGWALAFALAFAPVVPAQGDAGRKATVGMRAVLHQVVLPGSELVPAPSDSKSPVLVRVLGTWPHGDGHRYDLEWTGLEPGRFDLVRSLVRKDGTATLGLPPLEVEVASVLPPGQVEPADLAPTAPDRLGGYRTQQIVAGVLWVLGLLAILFVGRRFRRTRHAVTAPPTLADRLRPLVERVVTGRADVAAQAELERLLLAFWRERLELREHKAGDAIAAIRRHPEAGALLRQIEAWLHQPVPPAGIDPVALLAPYRTVAADSVLPRLGAS